MTGVLSFALAVEQRFAVAQEDTVASSGPASSLDLALHKAFAALA